MMKVVEKIYHQQQVLDRFSPGVNFGIDLEECEISSVSRYIPIVVEILTRLVDS